MVRTRSQGNARNFHLYLVVLTQLNKFHKYVRCLQWPTQNRKMLQDNGKEQRKMLQYI